MLGTDMERRVGLAATLAPLGEVNDGLDFISRSGFDGVQLSASQPGLRPRELDAGARRALRERFRRLELVVSGIDLWIPVEHFADAALVSRATDACMESLRWAEWLGRAPLSMVLPSNDAAGEVRAILLREADRRGVSIVDFAEPAVAEGPVRIGLDVARLRSRHEPMLEAIVLAGGGLGAIRLSLPDSTAGRQPFRPGGEGLEVLREVQVSLRSGGFPGLPVADARSWPDARAGLRSTRDAWNAAAAVG